MFERADGGLGGGGGAGGDGPRASVALTARQWSALVMAVSHGVTAIKDSNKLPVITISQILDDLAGATAEIERRLGFEAKARGERGSGGGDAL